MKIKFSGLGVVDGRGKINGTVASKNRSGAYARVKVSGVNPQTSYQLNVRARLTSFSQLWRTLAASQIDAWNNAAPQYTGSDVFGDGTSPTGQALFVQLNANLDSVGRPPLTDPPQSLPIQQPLITGLTLNQVGNMDVAFTGVLGDSKVQVWATAPQSPGVRSLGSKFRLIESFGGGDGSPRNIIAGYTAKFGTPPVGALIGVQLVTVNVYSGVRSRLTRGTALVN